MDSSTTMEVGNIVLLNLMLVAIALAWYSGFKAQLKNKIYYQKKQDKDYFIGLNYLLNDEPDQSIDAFISTLEINSSTVESHLALGTLLRRRGKVDGSISVYQKLLANSQLNKHELDQVKLGLIKSYVAAGLLDRAEKLIDELKIASPDIQFSALNQGLTVYQLEKEWLKATIIANDLLKICSPNQRPIYQLKASHFFCELSENELEFQHFNQARDYLKKARGMDKNNVRTNMILAKLEFEQGNFKQAIKALNKISIQDAGFKSEAFDLLIAAYQALGNKKELQRYIDYCLQEPHSPSFLLMLTSYIESSEGREKAKEIFFQQMKLNPSIELLGQAILLNEGESDSSVDKKNTELFSQILEDYLAMKAKYRCGNCGFELRNLHWLCPGCNEWGTLKPYSFFLDEEKSLKSKL